MPRILVADDNTNIQKMVSLAFQERGVEVTSVGNGEAAVRRLPDLNPDLILADIFMPVRNGYELCEWVKKDSKYSHIPVILLVGAFDPLDEKEARRVGADGVLKKPFIPPDPLIAMVTSTLEKNPKLAAELAQAHQAREKQAAAPPPAPFVAPELPKKIELQPVTECPEPSSDDASLAYGFGAGRRGLEDDGHDETAAARAPKSAFDKQAEEEFDGASTTNDWRRSAMAFEVPEEASRMAAFSEEESEPVASHNSTAANNTDAPPAVEFHQAETQPVIEASVVEVEPPVQDVAQDIVQAIVQEVVPDVIQGEPSIEAEHGVSAEQLESFHFADGSVTHSAEAESEWASDEPDIPASPLFSLTGPASENAEPLPDAVAKMETPSPVVEKESAHTAPSEPEPSSAPKAPHWMDLMGSVSDQPQSDWLSLISVKSKAQPADEASLAQKTEEPPDVRPESPSESAAHPDLHGEQVVVEQASEQESPTVSLGADSVPAQQNSETPGSEDEDWFFADEPADAEVASGSIQSSSSNAAASALSSDARQETPAPGQSHSSYPVSQSLDSAAGQADEFEATVAEPVAVNALHEETEFAEETSEEPVAASEPELIQPPAVHVTPEPLLVDESSLKPSAAYGNTDQEIAPTYEFLPEVESKAGQNSSSAEFSEARMVEESTGTVSAGAEPASSAESSSAFDQSAPPFVHPPTREQLAHIPFLNPPPHLDQESQPVGSNTHAAAELQAVETVVQRILDKIEPQLHDLLAQNLKPLIENLVHSELKKDR